MQVEKDEMVKDKMAIIQHLEIEKEQLAEISHMQAEEVTLNLMRVFEKFRKNKLIDSLREDVMFVLDEVNNLQEQKQALQGQLDESRLKMQKVSKKSS